MPVVNRVALVEPIRTKMLDSLDADATGVNNRALCFGMEVVRESQSSFVFQHIDYDRYGSVQPADTFTPHAR